YCIEYMPRPKKAEEPSEPDPKYADWILAAIAKVRHQNQRPNKERITHILKITYGVDTATVAEQLDICVIKLVVSFVGILKGTRHIKILLF
ncbi:histone acetyltransferase KAT6B-like, partial [Paramuricea clavata]